jgi:hypothetical protein
MVTKTGQVNLQLPLAEAYRRSAQALNIIGGTVKSEDQSAGRIVGTVPMSWTSWGESLLVEVSGVDNDALVRVTSKTRLPTQVVDFGKNARNVARFLDWLSRSPTRG